MLGRRVVAVTTPYWRPGQDYVRIVAEAVSGKVSDGDIVAVSEKAISTASGNIIDEKHVKPSWTAKLIARWWMRIGWGYLLGPLCHMQPKLLNHLRRYPEHLGSRHKQVALQQAGFLQALMFGSEGGIDGSNVPGSYVSLPLNDAEEVAEKICREARRKSGRHVAVMIVDTDKTYSFRGFHLTPRPAPMRGIHSFGGPASYVVGRVLRLKRRATPLAVAGERFPVDEALELADAANRSRGHGAGRTVWEMAERFGVELTGVTWEMLEAVRHKPIVIIRRQEGGKS